MNSLATIRAAALIAVLALGCKKKHPDPYHIELGDYRSGKQLADTLKRWLPPGTRIPVAWAMMNTNGFGCAERSAFVGVDSQTKTLKSGKPYLHCYKSTRILGLERGGWTVNFEFDSARVTDIAASDRFMP